MTRPWATKTWVRVFAIVGSFPGHTLEVLKIRRIR